MKKRKIETCVEEHTQIARYVRGDSGAVRRRERSLIAAGICRVPVVLIGYLHLVLNVVVISVTCYALIYVVASVQGDIRHRIADRRTKIEQEIGEARSLYEINKCDPSTRVPAIEELCNEWECIIKNGYGSIGYTRIIAEVFGDVVDGFVRKFSIRSSLVVGFFFILFLVFRKGRQA